VKCTALTIFPDALHEVIVRALKEGDDVLVQRVHVLDQPLGAVVGHRAGIVKELALNSGFSNLGWLLCWAMSFSVKDLSVAFGNQHSSSSRAKTPRGCSRGNILPH